MSMTYGAREDHRFKRQDESLIQEEFLHIINNNTKAAWLSYYLRW